MTPDQNYVTTAREGERKGEDSKREDKKKENTAPPPIKAYQVLPDKLLSLTPQTSHGPTVGMSR